MDINMVRSLFSLFSGESDTVQYLPLFDAAEKEVQRKLRSEADAEDVRLNYLIAAVANVHFSEIYGAREKALATYAGKFTRETEGERQLRFARHLVASYTTLCSDLLEDATFHFLGVSSHA